MLLIGFLPLILVPFVLWEWPLPDGGMWSTSFNYLTGVLHVGMTVAFYVDPELPARFKNLTLSYRLYRSVGQTASR